MGNPTPNPVSLLNWLSGHTYLWTRQVGHHLGLGNLGRTSESSGISRFLLSQTVPLDTLFKEVPSVHQPQILKPLSSPSHAPGFSQEANFSEVLVSKEIVRTGATASAGHWEQVPTF